MKKWRTIKKDIKAALASYSHTIDYYKPTGKGDTAECSVFVINITASDYNFDDVLNDLKQVCTEYTLSPYIDYPEVHLCAHWDIKK